MVRAVLNWGFRARRIKGKDKSEDSSGNFVTNFYILSHSSVIVKWLRLHCEYQNPLLLMQML
jgi:hypothetical protein